MKIDPIDRKWRTSRRNPQVMHVIIGDEPDDMDPVIGMMNSVQLSREAVASHNAILELRNK